MTSTVGYLDRVAGMLRELGIPVSYGTDRNIPLCLETADLVPVGRDIHGRVQRLAPQAARAWSELCLAAKKEGIDLSLVSSFRSLDYQRQIWQRKLNAGQSVEKILRVNAPPGYSEHHTGRAVDLTTSGCAPLCEKFEQTAAFAWLVRRGRDFGFVLTYPRNNKYGMAYEPWHWSVQAEPT